MMTETIDLTNNRIKFYRAKEMFYFDRLPKELRMFVADFPLCLSTERVFKTYLSLNKNINFTKTVVTTKLRNHLPGS